MIGYPSHPRSRSTNIKVGGIYSYKLSAGALWGVARRGGFVSIKGIEVLSYSTSALSFLSPRQRPTYISRLLLAPTLYRPFFRCSLMPYRTHSVSLRRTPDWKANLSPATSFFASPHPVSEPRVLCFLLPETQPSQTY